MQRSLTARRDHGGSDRGHCGSSRGTVERGYRRYSRCRTRLHRWMVHRGRSTNGAGAASGARETKRDNRSSFGSEPSHPDERHDAGSEHASGRRLQHPRCRTQGRSPHSGYLWRRSKRARDGSNVGRLYAPGQGEWPVGDHERSLGEQPAKMSPHSVLTRYQIRFGLLPLVARLLVTPEFLVAVRGKTFGWSGQAAYMQSKEMMMIVPLLAT